MINIRPHHLLCMRAYIGNGYSEEFKIEMEKVINSVPSDQKVKAKIVLEINDLHPIAQKLKDLYTNDKEELKNYTKILFATSKLIEGLSVENPTEISNLICDAISK